MKLILSVLILTFSLKGGYSQTSETPYRIFGEISTVENQTYRGFITWGEMKNYWVDFFEASKTKNDYSHYFKPGDGVIFYQDGRIFAKPPIHLFVCRFGNLRTIRLTGENEIELELKNGEKLPLTKGNLSDINTPVQITTTQDTLTLKWERISEIRFMSADNNLPAPEINQIAGIVKSSQGLYKGLITWNCNKKRNAEKNILINTFLNRMDKVVRDKGIFKVLPKENLFRGAVDIKTDILYPVENIMVNMPSVGSVIIPPALFQELEIIPVKDLHLLSYDDFKAPQKIQGEVCTRSDEKVYGYLAYDLDESLNIEVLDGKNDNISYRIPFQYIRTIEPKNYKYSYITLQNGSSLSLGDAPDVNRENSGIIIFGTHQIPTYILWNEVKMIYINLSERK